MLPGAARNRRQVLAIDGYHATRRPPERRECGVRGGGNVHDRAVLIEQREPREHGVPGAGRSQLTVHEAVVDVLRVADGGQRRDVCRVEVAYGQIHFLERRYSGWRRAENGPLTSQYRPRRSVGLALECVPDSSLTEAALWRTPALLQDVSEFVGNELAPERCVGGIRSRAKDDVRSDCKRPRVDSVGGVRCSRVGVNPDIAEVSPETRTEVVAAPSVEGLSVHRNRTTHRRVDA